MYKEEKYGWYLPDNEHRTKELLDNCKFSTSGTQGSGQRRLAIACSDAHNTVIDIGGHIGCWAKDFTNYFDKTIVFEPIYNHYNCLLKNLEKVSNKKYRTFNLGISEEDSELNIFSANYNTGQSRIINSDGTLLNYKTCKNDNIKAALDHNGWGGVVSKVKVVNLDSFLDKKIKKGKSFYDKIDLIKIDVEGHELSVIKGSVKTILKNKPILIIEILDRGNSAAGKKVFDFLKNELNYISVNGEKITGNKMLDKWEKLKKDFIFCHKSDFKEVCKRYNYFFKNTASSCGFLNF